MCAAASAAKRIISTAPIAKLGAISTFAWRAALRRPRLCSGCRVEAGGADHDVHAGAQARQRVLAAPCPGW